MSQSRRDFIKFIVAGSVATGCPIEESLLSCPEPAAAGGAIVNGEHYETCHKLRDNFPFDRPPATRNAAVVIIGGGIAGLSAAYFLQKRDFLLLEKEARFGGNALQEEFRGAAYSTGSAYAFKGDEADQLARELGLPLLPVENPDPTIIKGAFVADTWRSGLDQLPYSQDVRDSFKKFRDIARKIDTKTNANDLDQEPFSKYTAGLAPEVQQWLDGLGLSDWGAATAESSALAGFRGLEGFIGDAPDGRVTLPGGLGAVSHKLVEVLQAKQRERMLWGATVVAVVPGKGEVQVTYQHNQKLVTIAAKAVLMCTPKFITSRIISVIPNEQKLAMRHIRYAPYPVVNLIFEKPVYSRGYDTWCPGNTFTDFVVADWTVRNQPGYQQKYNILTAYTPLREPQRRNLLAEDECKTLAAAVLKDFQGLLPEFHVNPVEVHIYRRGHAMFMPTPGTYSKTIPAARAPMERIFFGNADSGGPESMASEAIRISRIGAQWAEKLLAGKPRAQDFAVHALAASA